MNSLEKTEIPEWEADPTSNGRHKLIIEKGGRNGLIERIIENSLTNTNEKGCQIPFCQYLISKGHTALGVSFHG
ncbi:MAG: hypothetical protein ACETWE_00910, partial [Candidatus Bathyarchaeia archaeon]